MLRDAAYSRDIDEFVRSVDFSWGMKMCVWELPAPVTLVVLLVGTAIKIG
jgi:hypothetical protein